MQTSCVSALHRGMHQMKCQVYYLMTVHQRQGYTAVCREGWNLHLVLLTTQGLYFVQGTLDVPEQRAGLQIQNILVDVCCTAMRHLLHILVI